LTLSGTHQLLIYAEDVNLLCKIVNGMKEDTEAVLGTMKEVGVEGSKH